jgi:DNA topoisomerase-1
VSIPEDIPLDELTPERVKELLEAPSGDRELGEHPESGETVYVKVGRYGPYVQAGEREEGSKAKVPTASLFKDMDPATVTLDDAMQLLSLPRTVGEDPESGEPITAQNGRYGPYLKKGEDTRSLENERDLFTVDLEGALALFAEPKRRRGQTAAAPLKDLGADPTTGCRMVVKDGRFGLYVTDGSVNASLPKGESPEKLTAERASELLATRRAKMKEQGKTVKPCKPMEEVASSK